MKPEVEPVCDGRMRSERWRSPCLFRKRVRPSLAYRQTTLITEDDRAPFHSPVDSFTTPEYPCLEVSRCKWWPGQRHMWSGSCCKQAVPSGSWRHSMCNMCRISSLMLLERPPLLALCVDLDVRLYYSVVQNMVYGYGNVLQSTAESSDTPSIHCDQHFQQSVDMSILLPGGLQCDPVQMTYNDNRFKTLGTMYHRMTFDTFVAVCMREYTPALLPERTTLFINVIVWAPLIVTCVLHLIWICYNALLQW